MMSSENPPGENNDNVEIQRPIPKKRGRKRKSEIVVRELEEEIEISPKEETVSRRGRPRKRVNYYELANPENIDIVISAQTEIDFFNTENEEIVRKKPPVEKPSPPEIPVERKVLANQPDEGNILLKTGLFSSEKDLSNGDNGEDNTETNNPNLEDSATTSTTNSKDKKYNYTGETVKMMNKLFSLFSNTGEKESNENGELSNAGKRSYRKQNIINDSDDLDDGTGNVTCAVCNKTFDKSLWVHHKQRYHNNLAWRIGDPPLDLNDQAFVMHTLNALYKKKKPLYCDKCGEVKKSVVGFLSHRSQCLKSGEQLESVKISCEICGRKMLPVSLTTHMKMLHQNTEKEETVEKQLNAIMKPLPSKRSAAKKALRMIENVTKIDNKDQYFTSNLDLGSQEFAKKLIQKELDETQFFECKFRCNCITTNMEDALRHIEECTEKHTEGFMCKQCLMISKTLEDMIYHIEFTHDINITVNGTSQSVESVDKDDNTLPVFLRTRIRRAEKVLFPFAFDWTFKFCEENFSDKVHSKLAFSEINWPLLKPELVAQYLPKLNESCDVAQIEVSSFINPLNDDYTFKKFQLFESEIHKDHKITLFCGGPISSMAWLPTPYNSLETNQILAVGTLNSPDKNYETYENYNEKCVIQFWSFGQLKNSEAVYKRPELVFSVVHEDGPVWYLEWCPSGCFNVEEGRMGLLAVAGSSSEVYIYSIPFYTEVGLFYKPRPVMKLLLQRPENPLFGRIKYYPSKISWSKASGHNFIAVGYTNGFVALFNIQTNSVILKYNDSDNIPCILPLKCFQAHSHSITALTLYHLDGGCRWLLTGSLDRIVSLWDLNNHSYPICTSRKNIVTDGFWLTHWLSYIVTEDEGSTNLHVTTMLKQARDFMYNDTNITLTCSSSTIWSISGSDWLNGLLHANTVGEIVALFPHQILQASEQKRALKSKRLLFGYTHLIEKNKSGDERIADDKIRKKTLQNLLAKRKVSGSVANIKSDFDSKDLFVNEPVLYSEAEQKYALLFCDNKLESYLGFPKTMLKQLSALSKEYGTTQPNRYPLNTINKIVFNPNRQASLYYATGYQAGFVRISWMEFLKNDQQIK